MGATTFDFAGRVIVITGGARGIGRGAAEGFGLARGRVYVVDVDEKEGEAVARSIRERGGQATFAACDVTDAARVRAAFERITGEAGRLDVLVNCAGGFFKQLSVEDTSEEEWDAIVAPTSRRRSLCAKAAIPTFKRQGSGRIINIGSVAGLTAFAGTSPPYAAAKAAVHSFTRVLAMELGKYGVTANAVAPGTTASERVVAVRGPSSWRRSARTRRWGDRPGVRHRGLDPFLASPEGGYLTGQTISVNGGRVMV